MEYKVITREELLKANTYVPFMEKASFVIKNSEKCFDTLNIMANTNDESKAMPPLYRVGEFAKSRYLMCALAKLYLKDEVGTVDGDEWLMAIDEYDKYAGGHIFEQINKFKSDAELRDICFNLLNDYKDLAKKFDSAINGLLIAMNDPVSRAVSYLATATTPENIQESMNELEKLKGEMDALRAARPEFNEDEQKDG